MEVYVLSNGSWRPLTNLTAFQVCHLNVAAIFSGPSLHMAYIHCKKYLVRTG